MNIDEFIKNNNIAIFVVADLITKSFDIKKMDVELESYDLFKQIILVSNTTSLLESVTGQILPRIWIQGNTKCIVCMPNSEQIIVMFYENCLDAKENYFLAKNLDEQIKHIF